MESKSGEDADEHKSRRWERLEDPKTKQPRKGWSKYMPTGELYYRETFRKLGIPDLQVATGEKTFLRAKTVADIAVTRWKNRHLGIADSHVFGRSRVATTVGQVIDKVLADPPNLREGTIAMRQFYLEELRDAFGTEDINAITRERFREQVKKWRKTRKRKTYGDFAKYMNVALRYAHEEMKVADHLVTVDAGDERAPEGRVYNRKELRALWAVMSEDLRDQFVLSYENYMRLREVLHLTWDRIDLKTGKLTLRAVDVKTGSKTGRGREFIVSRHALERLRARYARRRTERQKSSPYVFPSKNDPNFPAHDNKTAWNRAKAAARIVGRARWHDLRHAGFTHAIEKGADIAKLSDRGGASIRTLQKIYLHLKAHSTRDIADLVNIGGEE